MAVIMIVEDEFFIRGIAETMIQGWGHETLVAGDVDEALFLLRSPISIDALFTDIRLKKVRHGGLEVANEAIKLRPNIKVLYTTGFDASDDARVLFVERAHFLAKPYTPLHLKAAVEFLLAADLTLAA